MRIREYFYYLFYYFLFFAASAPCASGQFPGASDRSDFGFSIKSEQSEILSVAATWRFVPGCVFGLCVSEQRIPGFYAQSRRISEQRSSVAAVQSHHFSVAATQSDYSSSVVVVIIAGIHCGVESGNDVNKPASHGNRMISESLIESA